MLEVRRLYLVRVVERYYLLWGADREFGIKALEKKIDSSYEGFNVRSVIEFITNYQISLFPTSVMMQKV